MSIAIYLYTEWKDPFVLLDWFKTEPISSTKKNVSSTKKEENEMNALACGSGYDRETLL